MLKPQLIQSVTFVSGVFLSAVAPGGAAEPPPPNVLVIIADDLGWADLGCQGSKDIRTPHIDRLAKGGVRCLDGYVTSSVCGPSRAAIMTGRFHERTGISGNKDSSAGLPLRERTMGDIMRGLGYHTMAIGKWHLGDGREYHPLNRGFDDFFGFQEGGMHYLPFSEAGMKKDGAQKLLDGFEAVTLGPTSYLTDVFTDEAVKRIEANRDRPWFLYLAYNAPHMPLVSTPEYDARNAHIADPKRRTYAGMMTALDDGVGRVLGTLDRLHLTERTLIFFISDNGGPTAKTTSRNDPFRGVKGDVLEGGIRVPYIVNWKGTIPAGAEYPEPVQTLDVLATMVAIAGGDPKHYPQLEGVDLIPYFTGAQTRAPHSVMYYSRHERKAMRAGTTKLILGGPKDTLGLYDMTENYREDPRKKLEKPAEAKAMEKSFNVWWEGVLADRSAELRGEKSKAARDANAVIMSHPR